MLLGEATVQVVIHWLTRLVEPLGLASEAFFSLQLFCSVASALPPQVLSEIFPNRRPGSMVFMGDTGAVLHGVPSGQHVYNRRYPRLVWEKNLIVGDGKQVAVSFYGDLDVILHSTVPGKEDVLITLNNVAVVPDLAFNIISFNRIQEQQLIVLHPDGAAMMNGRVNFTKYPQGNFIEATRVAHDEARHGPAALCAAVMRPGKPFSIDVNDFHASLGHTNIKSMIETAKQMGIKQTGIQRYSDG